MHTPIGSQALAVEAIPQTAAPQAGKPKVAAPGADFTGIAALSNCSASLIRYAESASTAYGQQTWWLYTCLTASRTIDLNKAGCELVKPTR